MSLLSRSLSTALLLGLPLALGAQPSPPSVRTVAPKAVTTSTSYVVPGRTEPFESARIFTRATGIVQERLFDIGDLVKAGDVLAVIAAPDLDRAIEAARASVDQAEVRAANARTVANRLNNLLNARATSQDEFDQRLADAEAAEAAVRVAKADLARLVEQKGFATVRAPFDAVIAARNFDRGDRVRGDAATAEGWLYQLVRIDQLRFTVFGTPDLALRLRPNTTAEVTFAEFPGKKFTAKVARSSRIFDPTAGTMRIELILDNPDLAVPAGLTGNAAFAVAPLASTFLIPTNSVIVQQGQGRVATVEDGKVALIDITVGRNLGTQVEATSPRLSPTSAIIVNPNALLRSGEAVVIAQNAPEKKKE